MANLEIRVFPCSSVSKNAQSILPVWVGWAKLFA